MRVCVECDYGNYISNPQTPILPSLYMEYGKGNIALIKCPQCFKVADPYLEVDPISLLIDLILHKPQAYRHFLLNRMDNEDKFLSSLETSSQYGNDRKSGLYGGRLRRLGKGPLRWPIVKFSLILLIFDVYLKWTWRSSKEQTLSSIDTLLSVFYLGATSFLEFSLHQLLVRIASSIYLGRWRTIFIQKGFLAADAVVSALILSSFPKIFHILAVIWDFHQTKAPHNLIDMLKGNIALEFSTIISFLTITCHIESLSVILGIRYPVSLVIVICSLLGRDFVINQLPLY